MAEHITWTICGQRKGADDRSVYLPSETHPTKREALTALMAKRKDKSPIVRDGHTYYYTAREE